MLLRAGKIATLLCLFSLFGGHWGSLQCVAWVQMVVDRSADYQSVTQLVTETVSGAKPCSLCILIQKGAHQEQQTKSEPTQQKPPISLIAQGLSFFVLTPPAPRSRGLEPGTYGNRRQEAPPAEPPRSLA